MGGWSHVKPIVSNLKLVSIIQGWFRLMWCISFCQRVWPSKRWPKSLCRIYCDEAGPKTKKNFYIYLVYALAPKNTFSITWYAERLSRASLYAFTHACVFSITRFSIQTHTHTLTRPKTSTQSRLIFYSSRAGPWIWVYRVLMERHSGLDWVEFSWYWSRSNMCLWLLLYVYTHFNIHFIY